MPKHTHTHILIIDVCHEFDVLDCTALLLIITERKVMESVLSGHKNQAWIKLTQEIKQVRQIMFLFFFLNMHVLS